MWSAPIAFHRTNHRIRALRLGGAGGRCAAFPQNCPRGDSQFLHQSGHRDGRLQGDAGTRSRIAASGLDRRNIPTIGAKGCRNPIAARGHPQLCRAARAKTSVTGKSGDSSLPTTPFQDGRYRCQSHVPRQRESHRRGIGGQSRWAKEF